MNPKYPIYIISKGRYESRLTSKAFEEMNVPYKIVIEEQEYDEYAAVIDPKKILVLPFSNLGQGSIPARNWIMKHSIEAGAKRHWIIDDNIQGFVRLNRNKKIPVADGTIFKCAEDFTDRYSNVAISGFNYRFFASQRDKQPAYRKNRRVYSIILINNEISHRWRGRYNEDTDLSIRVLKDGWCTILFQTFLADKITTMTMTGGNTDELYKQDEDFDGRLEMAQSLVDQHPNIVSINWKWGRWQHEVDYRQFRKNKLKRIVDISKMPKIDNYGMVLKKIKGDEDED